MEEQLNICDNNGNSQKISPGWWRATGRQRAAILLGCAGWAMSGLVVAQSDDADKAKTIVATVCSACHGMDGNSTVATFPKLAGRQPEYVARELREFSSGKRKSDIMAPIVATIDPDDFKALGQYFSAQKPTSEPVLDQKAADAGKKQFLEGDEAHGVPSCDACHNTDASGSKRAPRLAGQHRQYLIDQLHNFQNDVRNYESARVMREVAKRLNDDQIRALAEYITGL